MKFWRIFQKACPKKGRTPLLKSSAAPVQAAVCGTFYARAFPRTEKFLVLRKMSVSSPKTRSSKIGTDAGQFTISAYLIIVN